MCYSGNAEKQRNEVQLRLSCTRRDGQPQWRMVLRLWPGVVGIGERRQAEEGAILCKVMILNGLNGHDARYTIHLRWWEWRREKPCMN